MKKTFVLLPAALMLLAGCGEPSEPAKPSEPVVTDNQVAEVIDEFGVEGEEISFQAYYLGGHIRSGDKGGYAFVGSGDRALQLYSPKQAMLEGLAKGDLVSVKGKYGVYSGMPQITMSKYDKKTKTDSYVGELVKVEGAAETVAWTGGDLKVEGAAQLVKNNLGRPVTATVTLASEITADSWGNKSVEVKLADGTQLHLKADSRDTESADLEKIVGEVGASLNLSGFLTYYQKDLGTIGEAVEGFTFNLVHVA